MSAPGTVKRGDIPSILRYAILMPIGTQLVALLQNLDPTLFGSWPMQIAATSVIAGVIGFLQRLLRNTDTPGA